jgi:stress response protein YsnF
MADKNINDNRLQELRGSGYEMADGNPDIRGWHVRNLQGQVIGKIEELLFDAQSRKVRYLIVNVEGKALNIVSRKILVPVGLAELHEENDDVIFPNVHRGHLASLPDYKKGKVTAATERAVRNAFINETPIVLDDDMNVAAPVVLEDDTNVDNTEDFYNHEYFDDAKIQSRRKRRLEDETTIPVIEENVNVGKQTVETGGVRVTKNIVEEPVEETIRLKDEHVTVNRNPVDKPVNEGNFAPFQESTIELTEHTEVPVVEKEARVVEEISIGKEVEHRKETVRDTVRKTEVDIEELDKNDLSARTNRNI